MSSQLVRCAKAARRVAEELGIDIEELEEEQYLKHRKKGEPSEFTIAHSKGWSVVKKVACQGRPQKTTPSIDPIPPGMEIGRISTLESFKDEEGNISQQWTIVKPGKYHKEEIIAQLMSRVKDEIPPIGPIYGPSDAELDDDLLAVYPVGDPHLGMLAWKPETGEDNYTLRDGSNLLKAATANLVQNGPKTSEALIANLGDFFHTDDDTNRTKRSGNVLDVDSRWGKILTVGVDTLVFMIETCLRHHKKVKVVNEIGNHDDRSAQVLSVCLNQRYMNNPRVEIDMSAERFHYHVFGKNLIGITHGHSVKSTDKYSDLESLMAHKMAKHWSQTVNRYWYVGHIHHKRVQEYRNCIVEAFRSLAPKDMWHSEHGYRSGRDMCRIVLHKEYGEMTRSLVSAAYLKSKLALV